jgi:asparagine synthase (glutamine-hydrolysing)
MCGIAGIIKWSHEAPAPWADPARPSPLAAMAAAIAHRGPDGQGIWTDPRPHYTAALVHRRLAIIDLPGGAQPMANEDHCVHVVFNGEIYNHAELRQQLQQRGHRFASDHSDTEVLVHGWEEWGTELPAKLLGMFAFAVWDSKTDTLFMGRDRMGQKPLFYATLEDGIVFGSTVNAVLQWPEVPRRVPRHQVALYLTLGYLPPPQTIYRDISQVMPGHFLRLRRDVLDGGRYWDPYAGNTATQSVAVPLRQTIANAVQSQLIADVPIACFLSGGIDSSIIATLMQQAVKNAGGDAIQTVSVGFAEASFDETQYAKLIADRIGSRHTRLQVDLHQDVLPTLERLMRETLGQPFADSSIIATFHLSRAVRAIAPVALSGDGGDELFAGYDRYRAIVLLQRWARVLRMMPSRAPVGNLAKQERYRRLAYAARGGDYAPGQYPRLMEIFPADDAEHLVGTSPLPLETLEDNAGPLRYAMFHDRKSYLPGDVLWKVDSASMAVALEVRSPFLDHHVVAQANALPDSDLIRGKTGKWILRQTFADALPPDILTRGKKGFAVPIGQWFNTDLAALLSDALTAPDSFARQNLNQPLVARLQHEHRTGTRDHTHRLFALLMLELWWKQSRATLEG